MTDSLLDAIALRHGTDKSSASHGYTAQYERYFVDLRDYGKLLELGWGGHEDPNAGGASARMWLDWLPKWEIFVVDNEKKVVDDIGPDKKLWLLTLDQTDPRLPHYGPFDVIIDDASHLSSLTIQSFKLLWPMLRPGGWYVVEDTHMAYHDFYYGPDEANPNPSVDRTNNFGGQTAMGFLKRLADEANFRGRTEWDLFPPEFSLGYEVEEVHFHFNIAFVKKRG